MAVRTACEVSKSTKQNRPESDTPFGRESMIYESAFSKQVSPSGKKDKKINKLLLKFSLIDIPTDGSTIPASPSRYVCFDWFVLFCFLIITVFLTRAILKVLTLRKFVVKKRFLYLCFVLYLCVRTDLVDLNLIRV